MGFQWILVILSCIALRSAFALWQCSEDSDCSDLSGAVCDNSECMCPFGQQSVLGGTLCADWSPYFTSPCMDDQQCSRLSFSFQCQRPDDSAAGNCLCQPGNHYFLGRCWRSVDYGEACSRDEECFGGIRDPYSLSCNSTCECAEGYYRRQRGECRRIGFEVGDGCVLDEDCQFPGGACDRRWLICFNNNSAAATIRQESPITAKSQSSTKMAPDNKMATVTKMASASNLTLRQDGVHCGADNACQPPFVCSTIGACFCPVGYYADEEGTTCFAELGSPATEEQCGGELAVVVNGICTCPANFFFGLNMRDCVKAVRMMSDSCMNDLNCLTFGAFSFCGAPQPPWQIRSCECVPDVSVWDPRRLMCRLVAGIGEPCQVDSDCMAGEMEIQCALDEDEQGYCVCPEGYYATGDGLCLTTGLNLGDACQATQECTETANTLCEGGFCVCDSTGYQEMDGDCAPIIGGICTEDEDCVIANTECHNDNETLTCQCNERFVEYDDECWHVVDGLYSQCNVTAQCVPSLGSNALCDQQICGCAEGHHHRDGFCWPRTGLFDSCSRSSECFLDNISSAVVCRNSMCQCDFEFPYSEEDHTCTGALASAASIVVGRTILVAAVTYLLLS